MNMRLTDVRIEDNIAVITIQNPPVNTLSMKTMEDIHSALTEVEQQGNVKAVILTGQGQHFVAGAELNEFLQIESKEAASQMSYIGYQLMDRIESFSVPVIAAIKGACLGGGLELALACHLRVATQEAIFGLPEITLGIIPGAGGTQRLPKVIGQARAIEMILTGERISAEEAKQLGLINKVCSQEELEKESLILAKRITAQGKVAIESALVSVMEGLLGSAKAGYRMEAEKFGHCFTTHDKREGVEAFLNRRKPQFQDR
ncbi:MAG TPA: enoyl-CoA hydratase [Bacilli bacterium]|nr:enoyl-CoA hydratase [Bacilli bacterium]